MALFFPGTPCALCKSPIEKLESGIGFAALPPTRSEFDDLYDACVHRSCLRSWTRKEAFVDHYNRLVGEWVKGRVSRLVIRPDGNVVHEVDDWGLDRLA